jgi:hypothetical protein
MCDSLRYPNMHEIICPFCGFVFLSSFIVRLLGVGSFCEVMS